MIPLAKIGLLFIAQTTAGSLQCDSAGTAVRWEPEHPLEGSVIQLIVTAEGGVAVHGAVANQTLHFERDAVGCYRALAPVPVGTTDTLAVPLRIERVSQGIERVTARIPVGRLRSAVLQLSVDPRFISPPDSALPRIQAERDLVIRVSRQSHATPRLWDRPFLRPRSTRITADFGQRREFNGEFRSMHMGVDLAGTTGAPVVAANNGVVVIVHDFYYAGNAIHIDHGNGITTAYMHLSEIQVAVGDTVARGEVIGRVGATGRVTGPHLHWHAKYGLVTVNPLTLLDIELAAPVAEP